MISKKTVILKDTCKKNYIKNNKGKIRYEIPYVFELYHIAVSFTEFGKNRFQKDSEYFERVRKHFSAYKNHLYIKFLNNYLGNDNESLWKYISMRTPLTQFALSSDGVFEEIEHPDYYLNKDLYRTIKENENLFLDYAITTNYSKFYQENNNYFQQILTEYKKKVDVKRMWIWLEKHFSLKYDSYRIIISPFINGSHNTQRLHKGDYKECFMIVEPADCYEGEYNKDIEKALLERIVFTEIDHNYVNPISYKYFSEIKEAIPDISIFNKQANYKSAYSTFNEYVTWALFYAYSHDEYDFDHTISDTYVNTMMVEWRKFPKFKEFTDFFFTLYNDNKNLTVDQYYPEIISWFKNYKG